MNKPTIILCNPQMGENIGAAARVMDNFAIADLRIVDPRDGWPNDKAEEMSAHALPLIENAQIHDTLEDALADCHFAAAITARQRDMVKPEYDSFQLDEVTKDKSEQKIALVFGAERSGLSNQQISLCNAVVTVPTNPKNPSLNLAQAVALMCYEWARGGGATSDNNRKENAIIPATKEAVNDLVGHLIVELDDSGFFKVAEKKPKMIYNLTNMFTRAGWTEQEVQTMRGVVKNLVNRDYG